ncbi:unnamed protein product [Spodoptera littoralis]|uniref:Homologous recombination OB-fold protein OB-fold domain-containing protein n=1 Tax=Spodoptera littoralis TaxID=7109 RepID=A0A9P0N1L2_SPOLI|nr:unnamed protein product [Spodoptera littoralis]CAH1639141.1 unnamed protein product [Spodoptera littoralis]
MFESDDYDQVLSQFEFPEDALVVNKNNPAKNDNVETTQTNGGQILNLNEDVPSNIEVLVRNNENIPNNSKENVVRNANSVISPKHTKRKMINSYFDHKSKRKFPGPAGLLSGGFEENENICQIELLSQDVDFTQNNLRGDLFESPLWVRLLDDLKTWNLHDVDSIKMVKQQAMSGNLRRRKAHTITAFVETVDRSATDPLIIMRDTTGNIKGTLHRDAWSSFSKYIASEYCAFILWKPTILTTGSAFKKHYLNITLSNILAVYSSTVLADDAEAKPLPDGYKIVYEEDYTVIKTEKNLNNIGTDETVTNGFDTNATDLLDELDTIFSDDVF